MDLYGVLIWFYMRQHVWFYVNHENKWYHVSFQWYLGSADVKFVLD